MPLRLTSPRFANEHDIPPRYTCDGDDLSPPLVWSDPPPGTKSFALVVDDPDAPNPKAPKGTFVHWVLYDLPASVRTLPEGVTPSKLPRGTVEARNDWHALGWRGPAPPIGKHRYIFKLYALDTFLSGHAPSTKRDLELAMAGHVLDQARLIGTYERNSA